VYQTFLKDENIVTCRNIRFHINLFILLLIYFSFFYTVDTFDILAVLVLVYSV